MGTVGTCTEQCSDVFGSCSDCPERTEQRYERTLAVEFIWTTDRTGVELIGERSVFLTCQKYSVRKPDRCRPRSTFPTTPADRDRFTIVRSSLVGLIWSTVCCRRRYLSQVIHTVWPKSYTSADKLIKPFFLYRITDSEAPRWNYVDARADLELPFPHMSFYPAVNDLHVQYLNFISNRLHSLWIKKEPIRARLLHINKNTCSNWRTLFLHFVSRETIAGIKTKS